MDKATEIEKLKEDLERWKAVAEDLYVTLINELGELSATRAYEEVLACG